MMKHSYLTWQDVVLYDKQIDTAIVINMERRIARFYDPTSVKRLGS